MKKIRLFYFFGRHNLSRSCSFQLTHFGLNFDWDINRRDSQCCYIAYLSVLIKSHISAAILSSKSTSNSTNLIRALHKQRTTKMLLVAGAVVLGA